MNKEEENEVNAKRELWQEEIWICALRYSLGRMTYITGVVSDFLMAQDISKRSKAVMIRDIEECDDYGMDYDEKVWMELLTHLKK